MRVKRQKSKEAFAEALLTLARSDQVERITVKQIVEASGLSLQTFYNHFHDKEDLVLWIIRFYADNANYLRSSIGSGIVNHYAEISAENTYRCLSAFICQRRGMEELPEELSFYLWMYVYACLYVFAEWSLKDWELPEERLAAYLEQGMPEKLKPYLLE